MKPLAWDAPIPFGNTRTGTAFFPPTLHALVGGATNAGKSNFLNNVLVGLAQREHTQMILVDPKMVELPEWQWGARAACIASGPASALPAFDLIQKEMMSRYDTSKRLRIKNHVPTEQSPRLVVVVDELAEVMLGDDGKDIQNVLQSILAMGRAAGIMLIDCTQQPDTGVVPSRLRNNHRQRICFGTESQEQTKMILGPDAGQIGCHRIPESMPGRGWMRVDRAFTEFRSYFITEDEVATVVDATAHLRREIPGFQPVIELVAKAKGGKK